MYALVAAAGLLGLLLTPAFKGMGFLLHIILPFSVGDGWNIFQS